MQVHIYIYRYINTCWICTLHMSYKWKITNIILNIIYASSTFFDNIYIYTLMYIIINIHKSYIHHLYTVYTIIYNKNIWGYLGYVLSCPTSWWSVPHSALVAGRCSPSAKPASLHWSGWRVAGAAVDSLWPKIDQTNLGILSLRSCLVHNLY